jgi:pentapeptide MXKDX repeat protein
MPSPGDCHVIIKRTAVILSAATLSFGLALAPAAFADDTMKKDTMSKDSMSKDAMKKDSMSKDSMSKDTMSKDSMSKDSMKKDRVCTPHWNRLSWQDDRVVLLRSGRPGLASQVEVAA